MAVRPGDELPEWTVEEVSVEKMKTMAALLADSNPIHWDVAAVRALGMGDRVVNQGPNNMAYLMNMLAAWSGDMGRVRGLTVRFLANVFAGDRLVAGGRVVAVDEDGAGGRTAVCDVWLDVQDGQRAISGTARVLLD